MPRISPAAVVLLALAGVPLGASAATHRPIGQETSILGYAEDGPADYRIDGDRGVWVHAIDGQWVYLHVQQPCPRLNPQTPLSIDTGPQGQLDRYSVLHVEGDRCLLTSVTTSAPPPDHRGRHRH